jgi:hypothetical protein
MRAKQQTPRYVPFTYAAGYACAPRSRAGVYALAVLLACLSLAPMRVLWGML